MKVRAHNLSEFEETLSQIRPQVNRTLSKSLSRIIAHPGYSYSRSLGESLRKSCSNGLSHPQMSTSKILQGHYQATNRRVGQSEEQVFVIAQDTVVLNMHTHKSMSGLKPLQEKLLGVLQHNALCLESQSGIPLGLVDVHNWTRKGYQAYELESQKWMPPLTKTNTLAQQHPTKRFVLVQDREADMYSFLTATRRENVDMVTRVYQNRKYELLYESPYSPPVYYLNQIVEHLPLLGTHQVEIYRDAQPLTLKVELSAAAIKIYQTNKKGRIKGKSKKMYLVCAKEVQAFNQKGKLVEPPTKAAQWLLLTNLEVEHLDQAKSVSSYYSQRWQVERLHYTMKSGAFQVERLQFDDVQTFCHALGLYTIAAWRIYMLQKIASEQPQTPAKLYFDEVERLILQNHSTKAIGNIFEAVQAVGLLVKFVPRKRQPLPGIKILGEGLKTLESIKTIWNKIKPKNKP